MKIERTGIVKHIGPLQTFDSGFQKQEIIVDVEPGATYPNDLGVEYIKDKTELIDGLKLGDEVTFTAFLNGRMWLKAGEDVSKTKAFNSLSGQTLEVLNSAAVEQEEEVIFISEDDDESSSLPF